MKAASDSECIKIRKMLAQKAMCVCEIHTILGIVQSIASRHLTSLEEAGLATSYEVSILPIPSNPSEAFVLLRKTLEEFNPGSHNSNKALTFNMSDYSIIRR